MKNIPICLAIAGLLVLPMAQAKPPSHKPVPAKHKPSPSPTPQKPSASKTFDSWKPDPSLLDDLAQETVVSGYAMRLPKGCSEDTLSPELVEQRQHGFDRHRYSGRVHPDGTKPVFGLTIFTPTPGMTGDISSDQAMQSSLSAWRRDLKNFIASPAQIGTMNGIIFERVYFKGVLSRGPISRMMHGFFYTTVYGKSEITLEAEDVEPYSDQALPTAEAAMLTFHRQTDQ